MAAIKHPLFKTEYLWGEGEWEFNEKRKEILKLYFITGL